MRAQGIDYEEILSRAKANKGLSITGKDSPTRDELTKLMLDHEWREFSYIFPHTSRYADMVLLNWNGSFLVKKRYGPVNGPAAFSYLMPLEKAARVCDSVRGFSYQLEATGLNTATLIHACPYEHGDGLYGIELMQGFVPGANLQDLFDFAYDDGDMAGMGTILRSMLDVPFHVWKQELPDADYNPTDAYQLPVGIDHKSTNYMTDGTDLVLVDIFGPCNRTQTGGFEFVEQNPELKDKDIGFRGDNLQYRLATLPGLVQKVFLELSAPNPEIFDPLFRMSIEYCQGVEREISDYLAEQRERQFPDFASHMGIGERHRFRGLRDQDIIRYV